MFTEEQAKEKRCCAPDGVGSHSGHCIGSGCMAWRAGPPLIEKTGSNVAMQVGPGHYQAVWKEDAHVRETPRGYCGLAGKMEASLPRDLDFAHPLVETPIELEPVFSLRGLIAWLETQPPEKEYNYWQTSGCGCLMLQWTEHRFGQHDKHQRYWQIIRETTLNEIATPLPWTFGAALTRARVALSGRGA